MFSSLQMPISFSDLALGGRFLLSLPSLLRRPIGVAEAQAVLRQRFEQREADFLALLRRGVYQHPASTYRTLLNLAGCEYGDLERLVRQDGVEQTLGQLYRRGVYLTVDELKGRGPVVRGSTTFRVEPHGLSNPAVSYHIVWGTGGSRGAKTPLQISLSRVRLQAVDRCLALAARGALRWRHAYWGVPGAAVTQILQYSATGSPPVRWFVQVDPATPGLHPRYLWSARVMRWGSLLAGVPLPRPEHVPLEQPLPIVNWMRDTLRAGQTPHLFAFASSCVRVCQAAVAAGIDLSGAQFSTVGEATTPRRLAAIQSAGAQAVPIYATAESGRIGDGCLAPTVSDEVHLLHDLAAVIQPGYEGATASLPADALLVSSIQSAASMILLNVSLGDRADLTRRACGCPLDGYGWTTHLHTIRSFEKLTAGGMTFLDTDVIRVLEEVLPARFGGGPTDYQLVEGEDENGRPRLRLLVHPALGPLDERAVAETFLQAIGGGSGAERVMMLQWRQAGLPRVDRQAPRTTVNGKILHLHQERRAARPPSQAPA